MDNISMKPWVLEFAELGGSIEPYGTCIVTKGNVGEITEAVYSIVDKFSTEEWDVNDILVELNALGFEVEMTGGVFTRVWI